MLLSGVTDVDDYRLDALALTETWIPSDAPDAVKLDVCPPGYQVLHRHRGTSDQRGGGVALVYRDTIKATTVDVGNYTEFESLAVKLTDRRSKASVVVCVYRPPGTVTSTFTDQLSDMLTQTVLGKHIDGVRVELVGDVPWHVEVADDDKTVAQ